MTSLPERIASREDRAVVDHLPRLAELQKRWNDALDIICPLFDDEGDDIEALETATTERWLTGRAINPDQPLVIGVAGPGASGKGTLSAMLMDELGYERVVNTTTRPPRHYERDGQDYHFLSASDFETRLAAGAFLVHMERAGRGSYGVSRREVEEKLSRGGAGCIIEENPRNLFTALDIAHQSNPNSQSVLLYILPPDPIVETSARRLYSRSAAEPTERRLTADDIESTLGDRQIDEFLDIYQVSAFPNVHVVFLVNDELEESRQKLTQLFGGPR